MRTTEGDFMKTKAKFLGFIALVAVIGFSIITCDNGNGCDCGDDEGGGSDDGGGGYGFTLTGIPSEYNGKWAMLLGRSEDDTATLYGGQSITIAQYSNGTIVEDYYIFAGSYISDGSVSLPMWKYLRTEIVSRYFGNDTAFCTVMIINSEKVVIPFSADIIDFASTKFSNGNASKTWSEGTVPK